MRGETGDSGNILFAATFNKHTHVIPLMLMLRNGGPHPWRGRGAAP